MLNIIVGGAWRLPSETPGSSRHLYLHLDPSIHGAFVLIVLGAALFAAAALAAPSRVQRRIGDYKGNGNETIQAIQTDPEHRRRYCGGALACVASLAKVGKDAVVVGQLHLICWDDAEQLAVGGVS